MLDLLRNENLPGLQICHLLFKETRSIDKRCKSNLKKKQSAFKKTVQLYIFFNISKLIEKPGVLSDCFFFFGARLNT